MYLIKSVLQDIDYKDGKLSDSSVALIYDRIFMPEALRMLSDQNPDVENYADGKNIFFLLPFLNQVDAIFREGEPGRRRLNGDMFTQGEYHPAVMDAIRTNVQQMIESKIATWNDANTPLDSSYMTGKTKEQAAADYVVNYMLANTNMLQLFIGDPANYTRTGDTVEQTIQRTLDNMSKRLAGDSAPGDDLAMDDNETVNYVVVEDRKTTDKAHLEYVERLAKKNGFSADPYKGLNATDAQEWVTWKEHIKVMRMRGQIDPVTLNRISKKLENPKATLSQRDLDIIFQPMKPVYVNNVRHGNVESRFYVKSSALPLLPQMTKGLEIDKLREQMEEQGIDRLAFSSAVKVGGPVNKLNIFDKDGAFNSNILKLGSRVRNVPRQGFKIQQEVPYKDKDTITDGTQQRKLLFSNIGDVEIKGRDGHSLRDSYFRKYDKIYKILEDELRNEVTEDGRVNISKLQNIIFNEAVDRGFNMNELIGFDTVNDGTSFRLPLAYALSNTRIQNLLSSIVDTRIRKLEAHGRSYVLASQEGFQAINDNTGITFIDGHDGNLKYGEVILPWNLRGDINLYTKNVDGKTVIDTNKLPKKILKQFGYRIPTQGLNSMASLKVVGFLPPNIKMDAVIASREFIAQMGSDFDIDKLYVQSYDYTLDKGAIKVIDRSNNPSEEKRMLMNEILDIHFDVLDSTSDRIQGQIVEPIGHDELQKLADQFDEIQSVPMFISDEYQKHEYTNALAGKNGIGTFSTISVFNVVAQGRGLFFWANKSKKKKLKYRMFGKDATEISDERTVDGKFKTSIISHFQSAAVDNAKDKILDKLNINDQTFPAINAMLTMGFEDKQIIAMVNQPIVREYVKALYTRRVKYGEFDSGAQQKAYQDAFNAIGGTREDIERLTDTEGIIEEIKADLIEKSEDELIEIAKEKDLNVDFQWALLEEFITLSALGTDLRAVSAAITPESGGLGKTTESNYAKLDLIANLPNHKRIANADKLIGDYKSTIVNPSEDQSDYGKLTDNQKEDYVLLPYHQVAIKPTTSNGSVGVRAIKTAVDLWAAHEPAITHDNVRRLIDQIQDGAVNFKNERAEDRADFRHRVWNNMKAYIFDRVIAESYDIADTQAERKRLLMPEYQYNEEGLAEKMVSEPLGIRLERFKKEKPEIARNPFIRKLSVYTRGEQPVTISYRASQAENFDESTLFAGFIEMVNSEDEQVRELADDLIKYAFLIGGTKTANDFMKFIPIEYLENIGMLEKIRGTHENEIFEPSKRSIFRKQFYMNNADLLSVHSKDSLNVLNKGENVLKSS
jgi:hypothetical protein